MIARVLRFALIAGTAVGPLWLIQNALRSEAEITARPFSLPRSPTTENFAQALALPGLPRIVANSVVVSSATALLTLALSLPAAVLLTRASPMLRSRAQIVLSLIYLTYPISLQVPWFRALAAIGLVDTRLGIVLVHTAVALPLATVLAESVFRAFPGGWHELATSWGMSVPAFLRHVAIPAARGPVASIGLIAFAVSWREYLFSFLLSYTTHTRTLTVHQVSLTEAESPPWGLLAVLSIFALLPAVLVAVVTPGLSTTLAQSERAR